MNVNEFQKAIRQESGGLEKDTRILIHRNAKYFEIKGIDFMLDCGKPTMLIMTGDEVKWKEE